MQLTKDEIDAIVYQCRQQGDDSTYTVVNAAIAAHTAKVLEDVEPVAETFFYGLLYPAHTVAALKSERDALAAALKKANDQAEHFERQWYLRGDELERLAARVAELAAALLKCRDMVEHPDNVAFIDAALAAKGQA